MGTIWIKAVNENILGPSGPDVWYTCSTEDKYQCYHVYIIDAKFCPICKDVTILPSSVPFQM